MVDVQTIGVLVTAASVTVATIYYIINLRYNKNAREMEVSKLITSQLTSEQGMQSYAKMMTMEWSDYDDFMKKYGYSNPGMFATWTSLFFMFEAMGVLIKSGVVNVENIYDLGGYGCIKAWEKYRDIIQGRRGISWGQDYMMNFEYLARELLKIKMRRDVSFKDKLEAYRNTGKL